MEHTLDNDNINFIYPLPDNTTELIVKADIVPDAYCQGEIALTTVIFPPINDRAVVAAVLAGQRRTGRMLLGFNRQLVDFMTQYTQVIGNRAFKDCSSLTSITLPPNSLRTIGNQAFSGCSSLTSITLPDSLTRIGESAFAGCRSLTSITLPDSLTTIGRWTFIRCSSLTSIMWCDKTFLPRDVVNGTLQNALAAGCKRDRKRKRDDEAGGAKKRSFTDTFR